MVALGPMCGATEMSVVVKGLRIILWQTRQWKLNLRCCTSRGHTHTWKSARPRTAPLAFNSTACVQSTRKIEIFDFPHLSGLPELFSTVKRENWLLHDSWQFLTRTEVQVQGLLLAGKALGNPEQPYFLLSFKFYRLGICRKKC